MDQLKRGLKIEREHKDTVRFVKQYFHKHKLLPSENLIFKKIVQDHLKEDPKYYTKLKNAKL